MYTGPAIKVGAGVLVAAASAAAHRASFRVVGGLCLTVGLAGGFTQGGGDGQLASTHGLATDNVLEWEVDTADGEHRTASPSGRHADLYWALSGSGGGTYAVIVSTTAKLHTDGLTTGARLQFNASSASSVDAYSTAVDTVHASLKPFVDTGAVAIANFANASAGPLVTAARASLDAQIRRLVASRRCRSSTGSALRTR
jgi:FAD/FMN-containing dehydrogenase